MNLRLGVHQLVVNRHPGRFLRRATPRHVAEMEASLDELARMLGDSLVWRLSGGLAIPTSFGCFYRRHGDIDIRVEDNVVPELLEITRRHGYLLFAHLGAVRLSTMRRVDHYVPVKAAEVRAGRHKAFRLVRSRSDGAIIPIERLHDSLDLHVYELKNGVMVNLQNGLQTPAGWLDGATYLTRSGRSIQVVDVRFVLECKKRYFSAADRLDKKMIARYLSSGSTKGVSRKGFS